MNSNEEFRYLVKFNYNDRTYCHILVSQKNLETQLKEDNARFIIDTIEGAALSWIKSQDLLVDDARLQNVCLCNENGEEIVYTGILPYK